MTRFRSSWLRLLVIGLVTCWVTSTHLWMPLWGIDAAVAIFAPFCVLAQLQTIPADRRAQYNRGHSGSSRFVDRAPENPRKKLQSLLEKSGAAAPSPSGACIAASGDPKRCEQDEEDEDDASPPVLSNEDSLVGATKRKDRAAAMKPVAESEDANSKVLKRPLSNSQQQQQQASPSAIISDIPCQSCLATTQDEPQSLLSLAQYGYWSHNLMIALGCSCMLITSENRLDPYAYALYSASADALQLMNQFASVIKAAPSVAPTSLRFASWEIVGPFFSAKSFFPVDPFVSYVRRFASRSDREELRGARRDGAGGSFDIAAEILRLPSSIRAPSAVSDAGFVSWTRIGAVEPSGVATTRFPLRVHERIPPSVASDPNSEAELMGWARSFGHVDQGTYVLACSGTSSVYLRSGNTTHPLSLIPWNGTEWSIASIDLKYGPLGIVARLSGTHSLSIGCSLTPSALFAIVPSMAASARGPASDGSRPFMTFAGAFRLPQDTTSRGAKQGGQLLVGDPLHVPDLLLDYDTAAPKGSPDHSECPTDARCHWGYVHKPGANSMGVLFSGLISLPIFSTESRSLNVRFEVESRRLLPNRISVQIPRFRTRRASHNQQDVSDAFENSNSNSESEDLSRAGARYQDRFSNSYVVQGGHFAVVPLEIFSDDEDGVFLTCRPSSDSAYTASLTLFVIPDRGPRQSVNLVLRCRRLNETIIFSYQDIDSSVASAYAIAPLALVPFAGALGSQGQSASSSLDSTNSPPSGATSKPASVSGNPLRKSGASESKRFDQLRNADASRLDPSAAARLGGQRIGTRPSPYIEMQSRTAPADHNEGESLSMSHDSEGARPSRTDNAIRSQFYVYQAPSADDPSISVGYLAHLEPNLVLNGEIGNATSRLFLQVLMASKYRGYPVIAVFAGPEFSLDEYIAAFSNDGATVGVDGAWVLIINYDPRCLSKSARLDAAIDALFSAVDSLKMLPRVDSTSRVLVGYGAGAHAALSTALAQPDRSTCLAAIAGSLRMDDISGAKLSSSTRLDASEPALGEVLVRPLREFHSARSISHGVGIRAKLRAIQHESSTHPWFTREMFRELMATNITTDFDSMSPSLPLSSSLPFLFNDDAMKSFYHQCVSKDQRLTSENTRKCKSHILFHVLTAYHRENLCGIEVIQQFRTYHTSLVRVDATFHSRFDLIVHATREIDEVRRGRNISDSYHSFEVSVSDVYYLDSTTASDRAHFDEWLEAQPEGEIIDAVGSGEGAEVHQMRRAESMSKVRAHPEMQDLFSLPTGLHGGVLCRIRTSNVRRLRMRRLLEDSCRADDMEHNNTIPATVVIVDGFVIHFEDGMATLDKVMDIELCWGSAGEARDRSQSKFHGPHVCQPSNTGDEVLREKNPATSASLNHILSGTAAARIVYGTPTHPLLRSALRETALVLANRLSISSSRSIQVFSDIEFREYFLDQSDKAISEAVSTQLIFIGDPTSNKVMKDLDAGIGILESKLPVLYSHLPSLNQGSSKGAVPGSGAGFVIGRYRFDDPDFVTLFTFPVTSRTWSDSSGEGGIATVAACISGNSAASYSNMLELVFAPSSSMPILLPDFVVISSDIWGYDMSRAIVLAGYWSPLWGFDPKQAYLSPWYRLR